MAFQCSSCNLAMQEWVCSLKNIFKTIRMTFRSSPRSSIVSGSAIRACAAWRIVSEQFMVWIGCTHSRWCNSHSSSTSTRSASPRSSFAHCVFSVQELPRAQPVQHQYLMQSWPRFSYGRLLVDLDELRHTTFVLLRRQKSGVFVVRRHPPPCVPSYDQCQRLPGSH